MQILPYPSVKKVTAVLVSNAGGEFKSSCKDSYPLESLMGKNFGYKQIRSAICRALLICYVI